MEIGKQWIVITILTGFVNGNSSWYTPGPAPGHMTWGGGAFIWFGFKYYLDLYSVVSYLCVVRRRLLNSEYIIVYSMQSAPFKFIKNCHSFSTILQSSVLTNDCDHTMKLLFIMKLRAW